MSADEVDRFAEIGLALQAKRNHFLDPFQEVVQRLSLSLTALY